MAHHAFDSSPNNSIVIEDPAGVERTVEYREDTFMQVGIRNSLQHFPGLANGPPFLFSNFKEAMQVFVIVIAVFKLTDSIQKNCFVKIDNEVISGCCQADTAQGENLCDF